jgi:hypothetical protein
MKRSGSPDEKFFHHTFWDIDPSLVTDLLFNEIHGEDWGKVLRADGLTCSRVDDGLKGAWQICLNIVPLFWDLIFPKKYFELLHNLLLSF